MRGGEDSSGVGEGREGRGGRGPLLCLQVGTRSSTHTFEVARECADAAQDSLRYYGGPSCAACGHSSCACGRKPAPPEPAV